jgi:hypothetical protein
MATGATLTITTMVATARTTKITTSSSNRGQWPRRRRLKRGGVGGGGRSDNGRGTFHSDLSLTLAITNGTWATLLPSPPVNKQQNHTTIFNTLLKEFCFNPPCNTTCHCQVSPPQPPIWVQYHSGIPPSLPKPFFSNCARATQIIHRQSKSNNYNFATLSNARLYNNIQTTRFLAHENINYPPLIIATNYLNNARHQ